MCILIAGMAFVDLSVPVFVIPNMLLNLLFDWRGISLIGCLVQMHFLHFVGTFQSTLLVWMALDRYFAISLCSNRASPGIKALHTCITHIVVITVSLTIALIAFLSYRIRNGLPAAIRVFISIMYPLFPSCFNPIIYGIRTTEIRQHIVKTLTSCNPTKTLDKEILKGEEDG
ncbi:hypothetical protein L3Q82_018530, partial [Scortum barcoo]